MIFTFEEVVAFNNAAVTWLNTNKDDTKFRWALKRVLDRVKPIIREFSDEETDININNCMVSDGKRAGDPPAGGLLRYPNGMFMFSTNGLHDVNKAIRKMREREVNIDPYLCSITPTDLSSDEEDAFEGFVIPEITEEPKDE